MCGIFGTISCMAHHTVDPQLLARMGACLRHRGPDDEGFYCDPDGSPVPHARLGMRRLSIIDLATGQQPISNEDGTLHLVFNGEIYNYRNLRQELMAVGHVFQSQSDSEVIIHAYEEWAADCVTRFNGMFAFAIWDSQTKRLFLARDRLGIKPLYYWSDGQHFVFASELSAVVCDPRVPRVIDPIALDRFLTLEYIPAPRTIYRNVYKLPPGHTLHFTHGPPTLRQYWEVQRDQVEFDEQSAAEHLSALIDDAVRLRLVSDVPLGLFLSGGLDSSSVLASMSRQVDRPVQTFSIGFDDVTYNELPDARAVATYFGTNHVEEVLAPNIADLAETLIRHLDEPLADFSIFPTFLVSQLASRTVKVVLCGDGGDEVFGGYDTYVAQQADRWYRLLPGTLRQSILPALLDWVPPQAAKKGIINKTKRFVEGGALPAPLQHTRWMIFLHEREKQALYRPALADAINDNSTASFITHHFQQAQQLPALSQQQHVDIKTYLADNILTKVDRMSMAASVEARVPLLDHRIVEFALNLPPNMKLHKGQTKRILRRAMQGRLPASTLHKPKQGFSIPLKQWLQTTLKPMMLDLLAPETIQRRGYFSPQTVSRWINEHLAGRANHSHRLWALMVLEKWQA